MFELSRYNQRLQRSVEIFGFKVPYSVDELDAATVEFLKRQGFQHAYVMPIAWCGSDVMASPTASTSATNCNR